LSLRLGKSLRLSQIIDPRDGKSLVLEADQGLTLGPIPGIEDLNAVLKKVRDKVDAVVLSQGQVGRLVDVFKGKDAPALIIRADWTNAFRDDESVLPAREIRYVLSTHVEDALMLGASGVVSYLFVGYDNDEDEANNIKSLAKLARECEEFGVPLIVESLPIGRRVTKENYLDCVKLAARISVETGADAIVTPYLENVDLIHEITELTKAPTFVLEGKTPANVLVDGLNKMVQAGIAGVVVGRRTLQSSDLPKLLDDLNKLIHS